MPQFFFFFFHGIFPAYGNDTPERHRRAIYAAAGMRYPAPVPGALLQGVKMKRFNWWLIMMLFGAFEPSVACSVCRLSHTRRWHSCRSGFPVWMVAADRHPVLLGGVRLSAQSETRCNSTAG